MSGEGRGSSSDAPPSGAPSESRALERHEVDWSVDCESPDTFLYASIANISELGIFIRTEEPLPVGTTLSLRFAVRGGDANPANGDVFLLRGRVQWINA